MPGIVLDDPLGLWAPQLSLKLFDFQCQQAIELTQLLVFLPEKPYLPGGFCGSDHTADAAADRFADKIANTYPQGYDRL